MIDISLICHIKYSLFTCFIAYFTIIEVLGKPHFLTECAKYQFSLNNHEVCKKK